jgi:hypothetical protein
MACLDFNKFSQYIMGLDQSVTIDDNKPLRYDVWKTTQEHVAKMTESLSTKGLPEPEQSQRILVKLKNALRRAKENGSDTGSVQEDIFSSQFNKEFSIALHEIMESIKGEADKARNLGIDISEVSANRANLPALPMNRIAASIGRKIAFQKGFRFKRPTNAESAKEIEALYYNIGSEAIRGLEELGYLKTDFDTGVIKDWMNPKDLGKDFPKGVNEVTTGIRSVRLNERKLGITKGSEEAKYFLNRTNADLDDTGLGVVTEKLRAANMILQPATYVIPDSEATQDPAELSRWDDGMDPDPVTEDVRNKLYEKPMKVNKAFGGLLDLLKEEHDNTGKTASKRIGEIFGHRKKMIAELFGLKRSDDFSIDRKESVSGQNLSKTTPVDDLVEYWDLLQGDLHMPMKIGRNGRMYYLNSVLNAHGSKQMRAMLTPGEYTVATGSADFDYLVRQVAQALKSKDQEFTYEDITSGDTLGPALEAYSKFAEAGTFRAKMQSLAQLSRIFPKSDFVTIVTALQAVQDIRSPTAGKVTTEFAVSSDAVASGGTLTFMQALGTNLDVTNLLQRIGMLKPEGLNAPPLDDIYHILVEAMDRRMGDESDTGFGPDLGEQDSVDIMRDTLEMLFLQQGKNIRDFAKDPTMTFIYGQGRTGAVDTMSRNLADTIIDNMDDPTVRKYLAKVTGKPEYEKAAGVDLRNEADLYKEITEAVKKSGLPGSLFDMMQENVKETFLAEYLERSQRVYNMVKELDLKVPFKVLPAGAVLAGDIDPTPENIAKYGMPLTKATWVHQEFDENADTVLTRSEKLTKTVMDVSTVHGIDAALMYHSMAQLKDPQGMLSIHDDVRGTVQDIRAMEAAYVATAKRVAKEYDIHQQIMESIAAQDPELANSPEFKALKKEIDEDVAEKGKIIDRLFNDETTALIGDGKHVEFAGKTAPEADTTVEPEVDTPPADTVQSSIPTGEPNAEQDFGEAVVVFEDGGKSVEVLAQDVWNDIQSRFDMVKKLNKCLTTS